MPDELLEIEATDSSSSAEALDALFHDQRADELSERRARVELRRQIGALERQLGELFASAFPRQGIDWSVGAVGGPRVLGIAELERVRDALAVRLRQAQAELGRRGEVEEANRGLLESMIADPRGAPLGAGLRGGRRRAELPPVALAPSVGHPRDADGLVAGQALIGLSVSQGPSGP